MIARRPLHVASSLVIGLLVCSRSHATAQETEPLNPMKAIARTTLKGFLERPLFDPARRLPPVVPPPPVAVPAPIADQPPTLHLLGVIHGKRDMAVVQRDGQAKPTILRNGDQIGNWILTVVPPVGVRLRHGDTIFDYALFGKSPVAAGPAVAGPVTVAPVAAAPVAATMGQVDAIGMPLGIPLNAWQTSPN